MSRLDVAVAGQLAVVTINCPERRNALDHESFAEFAPLFDDLSDRDDVWAVMITGAGDASFCAGRDLKAGGHTEKVRRMPTLGPSKYAFEAVRSCPKPVIGAINGWALGGGFELALACDLRVAAEHAKFGMPEAKLGLGGQFGGVMLPRLVPSAVANELLMLGEPITAQQALQWGLVSKVFPSGSFHESALAYGVELASRAPLTLQRYKALGHVTRSMSVEAAIAADPHPNPYRSNDAAEGVAAWKDKRPPRWSAS